MLDYGNEGGSWFGRAQGDLEETTLTKWVVVFRVFSIRDGENQEFNANIQLGKWSQGESNGIDK